MQEPEQDSSPKLIVPAANESGMTALHYAAYRNDAENVRSELRRGIPVDIRDDNGWAPLHWSIDMAEACGEPEKVVRLLLDQGASVNSIDNAGLSVLMIACGRNNEIIFDQLIDRGADITVTNATGATALHEAAGCNFTVAIRRLLKLGADPRQRDNLGRTPGQTAEACGFLESAALLKSS